MKHLIQFAWFVFLPFVAVLTSNKAYAVQVSGLYNATVPVASQQSKDRGDAFASALDIVLNKVSGNRSLHTTSGLVSILSRPEQFVSSFSYRDNPEFSQRQRELEEQAQALGSVEPETSDAKLAEELAGPDAGLVNNVAPYLLDVVFSSSAVNAKMSSYGVPIWGATRPSLLFWVATVEGAERRILGTADEIDITPVLDAAALQGLPAFFPVIDLEDMNAINVNDVWGLYPESIDKGARRYAPDVNVLVRRNTQRLSEREETTVALDWLFVFKGLQYTGTTKSDTNAEAWRQVMSEVSQVLATRYAVQQTSSLKSGLLTISVDAIETFADYAGLETYLSSLPTVKSSRLLWVKGNKASYALDLKGQRTQFFEYIDLGHKMKRLAPVLPLVVNDPVSSELDALDAELTAESMPADTEYFVWVHAAPLKD